MKEKYENIEKLLEKNRYSDLKLKDYISCGFSIEESKKLTEVGYSIIGISGFEYLRDVDFIIDSIPYIENIKLIFYFKFFLFQNFQNREKYNILCDLVNILIENFKNLFDVYNKDTNDVIMLNEIIIFSTKMNVKIYDILKILYWYCRNTNEIINFVQSLEHALNKLKNTEIRELFIILHNKWIEENLKNRNIISVFNYMENLTSNRNKIFNCDKYEKQIYDGCFKMGKIYRDFNGIDFINKSIKGYRKLNDIESENNAVVELQKLLKCVELHWHESIYEINDDEKKVISLMMNCFKKYIFNMDIEAVISLINKKVINTLCYKKDQKMKFITYEPCPSYTYMKTNEIKSPTDIFEHLTISDDRIIKKTTDPKYRDIYHEFHFKFNIIPLFNRIDDDINSFAKCLDYMIDASNWLTENTKQYFKRVLSYYNKNNTFEFLHFGPVLAEKLLRDIYISLKDTNLEVMKTANYAQVYVNIQDIMKADEIKEFFGEDIYKYIEYNLIDERGHNLRNKILHGLAKNDIFTHGYAMILMHTILLIFNHANEYLKDTSDGFLNK